jgi:hypothetical protein
MRERGSMYAESVAHGNIRLGRRNTIVHHMVIERADFMDALLVLMEEIGIEPDIIALLEPKIKDGDPCPIMIPSLTTMIMDGGHMQEHTIHMKCGNRGTIVPCVHHGSAGMIAHQLMLARQGA